jgi:hypothetical protein
MFPLNMNVWAFHLMVSEIRGLRFKITWRTPCTREPSRDCRKSRTTFRLLAHTSLAPDGTRMTMRNAGTPSGFATIAIPLMASSMRRAMTKDLGALKRILEHR